MAQTVTLANLRSDIREYIGAPSSTQLSDATILVDINKYYREVMPLQLDLPETKGVCTLTTADTNTSVDLPDDTLMIFPPVRIGSGATPASYDIGGYYTEPVHYYAKHDGSETKGTPVDILLVGRTVYIAPTAGGIYKILFPSIEKPTALSADSDVIVQDRLRDIIGISVAVSILGKRADTEGLAALNAIYPIYTNVLGQFGVKVDKERMSDARNRMKAGAANA